MATFRVHEINECPVTCCDIQPLVAGSEEGWGYSLVSPMHVYEGSEFKSSFNTIDRRYIKK